MSILYGATCIVGIIFMCVFIFIGIWLFIIALKSYRQLRYKNYILEKIYQKIDFNHNSKNDDILSDSIDFFNLNDNSDNDEDFDIKEN